MKALIITLVVLIVVWALVLWGERDQCPRVIRGYNCRGGDPRYSEGCDHSAKAVAEANWDMNRT